MAHQTAVELLHKESNELLTKYLDGKIDKRELITMHHNILYVHKEMEKEQIINAFGVGCQVESTRLIGYHGMAEQYYNETYNK